LMNDVPRGFSLRSAGLGMQRARQPYSPLGAQAYGGFLRRSYPSARAAGAR
jgi:hypothetical protein